VIRKTLLLAASLLAIWLCGRALFHALASPEKKIRWRIEEMVDGFNSMRVDPVLHGISPGFVDRTAVVTREELRQVLVWMFLNETDRENGFHWRAELEPDALSIELVADERSAEVSCGIRLLRLRGEEFALDWDARLAGKLARTEDGWQWVELTSANHAQRKRR
jgi:hypothetical protein